jgi:hypothetical protein
MSSKKQPFLRKSEFFYPHAPKKKARFRGISPARGNTFVLRPLLPEARHKMATAGHFQLVQKRLLGSFPEKITIPPMNKYLVFIKNLLKNMILPPP